MKTINIELDDNTHTIVSGLAQISGRTVEDEARNLMSHSLLTLMESQPSAFNDNRPLTDSE